MNTATNKNASKNWHPFKDISARKIKLTDGEDLNLCLNFVQDICEGQCCDRTSGHNHPRSCDCLSILRENVERQLAVSKYMVAFIARPQQERHSIVMEWLRYTTTKTGPCFFIPFVADKEQDGREDGEEEEYGDKVAPGIPPIKQVELFSKYRALIPEEFRNTTCPDPGDDIKMKIKSERNTKQRERNKKMKTEAWV